MVFNILPENSLYCWRLGTRYEPRNFYQVFRNDVTFQFPTGLKLIRDSSNREYLLAFTTRFQANTNNNINPNDINYRIMEVPFNDLVGGYPCSR